MSFSSRFLFLMMVLLNSFVFLLLLLACLPQPGELVSHGGAAEAHLEALGDAKNFLSYSILLISSCTAVAGSPASTAELCHHHLER
jgi:hypothetical protein